MFSMDSATQNAEKMLDELKLGSNKLRQAIITQEVSEIGASMGDEVL